MRPDLAASEPTASAAEASRFRQQMGTISRHSSVFFLGTIFTSAIGYVFKVYLARTLGAESLGIYALGMTIVGFLGIFSALGLPQAAVRFVAAYTGQGQVQRLRGFLVWSSLVLMLSSLFFAGLLLRFAPTIAVRFYHTPALVPYVGLFGMIMVFGALSNFMGQALVGYQQVARRTVIVSFIGSPLTMVFTVLLVAVGWGLRGYIAAQVASAIAMLLILAVSVWRLTPRAAKSSLSTLPGIDRDVVSFSATIFSIGFLEYLLSQADGVMIGYFRSAREIGIYAVTGALVTFVPVVLQSVNQIFSPMIASLHARGERVLLRRLFQTLTKWILGLTLPLAGIMIVFARPIMHIFGQGFEPGWPVLVIGTIGQLINCSVGSVGFLLMMSGHQSALIRIEAIMAVVMIGLNLILVPAWGIVGAAAAAAITTAIMNLWYLEEVRRKLSVLPYNRGYFRLLLPVLGLCLVLLASRLLLRGLQSNWIAIGASLFLAYAVFLGLVLTSGLDEDDKLIADAVLVRLRGWRLAGEGNTQ